MYYFYVLKSQKDQLLYWGFTHDLQRRFKEHQEGESHATRYRRPFKLVYYEACLDKHDAAHREKYLKTFHGKMFLKNRLKSYLTGLYNPT